MCESFRARPGTDILQTRLEKQSRATILHNKSLYFRSQTCRDKPMRIAVVLLCLLACNPKALAQAVAPVLPPGSGWSLGVVSVVREGIYAGEDFQTRIVPGIGYEGDRFFIRGLSGGVKLAGGDRVEIDALAKWSFGAEREDFSDRELAANGVVPEHVEGRNGVLEAGVSIRARTAAGEITLQALTAVLGSYDGAEASLVWGYPVRAGPVRITPEAYLTYVSEGKADYWFGFLPSEIARGAPDYQPGAYMTGGAGLRFFSPLSRRWSMFGQLRYEAVPDAVRSSPLTARLPDASVSGIIGIQRSF